MTGHRTVDCVSTLRQLSNYDRDINTVVRVLTIPNSNYINFTTPLILHLQISICVIGYTFLRELWRRWLFILEAHLIKSKVIKTRAQTLTELSKIQQNLVRPLFETSKLSIRVLDPDFDEDGFASAKNKEDNTECPSPPRPVRELEFSLVGLWEAVELERKNSLRNKGTAVTSESRQQLETLPTWKSSSTTFSKTQEQSELKPKNTPNSLLQVSSRTVFPESRNLSLASEKLDVNDKPPSSIFVKVPRIENHEESKPVQFDDEVEVEDGPHKVGITVYETVKQNWPRN
ncbi:hypothetical protein HDU76_005939, partial [Blyttiomyces sp. JEL0837]